MTFLNIRANQGITQAIAEKLKLTQRFSADTWNEVVGLVESESKQKNIFDESKGKDIDSKDYHSNYVVNTGKVELSDNTWNRICRILGKEKECVEIKSGNQQDTSPSVTQANNLAKAFNLITKGLRDGKLQGTPDGFRSAIVQAYGNIDTTEGKTPTVAEYVVSLLTDAQKIMGKTDNVCKDMVQRAIGGALELCPDGELYGKKCSEYSNPKVVEQFMKDNNITQQVQQAPQIKFSKEQLEAKVSNVKAKLNEVLKGKVFKGPNGTTVTGEQLLDIINNEKCFYYESSNYGAAQAHAQKGQIEININSGFSSDSDAELMKLIIHEALHVVYNTTTGNTREEERCCESQALEITAEIVKADKGKPDSTFTSFSIYNHNIEDFENQNLLDDTVSTWLTAGYSNRTENAGGDITIIRDTDLITPEKIYSGSTEYKQPENRIEIKQGDEVYIDGKKVTTIGEARLESILLTNNNGNSNICTLYVTTNRPPYGTVVFDGTIDRTGAEVPHTEPKTIEIRQQNGNIIKGKIYGYSE